MNSPLPESPERAFLNRFTQSYFVACTTFCLLLVALMALRSHNLLISPRMNVEDISVLFSFYYGAEHSIFSIFRPYNGYLSLLPQMIGWCLAWLPTLWQPYAYAIIPMLIWVGTFLMLATSPLWPTKRDGFLLGFLIGFGSFNQPLFYNNVICSQWCMLILFSILCAERFSPVCSKRRLWVGLLILLGLIPSHPYSILLAPLFLLQMTMQRGTARGQAAALATLCIVCFVTVDRSRTNLAAILDSESWRAGMDIIFHRVFMLSYFQTHAGTGTPLANTISILILGAFYMTLVIWFRYRQVRKPDAADGALLLLIVGYTVFYLVSYRFPKYGVELPNRYFIAQQYLWLVLLFRSLAFAASELPGRKPVRWTPHAALAGLVLYAQFSPAGNLANRPWGEERLPQIRSIAELERSVTEPTRYQVPGQFPLDVWVKPPE